MRLLNKVLLGLFIVGASSFSATAQEEDHEHHENEIGVANSPVYFVKEKEFTYGLHFHYVRTLKHSKFGVGLGYEKIFDEHEHQTFGVVLAYRPIDAWSLNVSPGVTMEKGLAQTELLFALHVETSYEWEIGHFHLGPVFEVAYDPEDYHISLGLHLGYGF